MTGGMTAKLFLHGVPDSPAIWSPLLDALALGDTPVAVPALPGFTGPLPAGFAATKEAYADWATGEAAALVGAERLWRTISGLLRLTVDAARREIWFFTGPRFPEEWLCFPIRFAARTPRTCRSTSSCAARWRWC